MGTPQALGMPLSLLLVLLLLGTLAEISGATALRKPERQQKNHQKEAAHAGRVHEEWAPNRPTRAGPYARRGRSPSKASLPASGLRTRASSVGTTQASTLDSLITRLSRGCSASGVSGKLGFSCSSGRIVALFSLSGCDLYDELIPSSISELGSLQSLTLRCNLQGPLPDSVGKLTKLTRLDLGSNNLGGGDPFFGDSDSIPGFITLLTRLAYLDLSRNEFGGDVPNDLTVLTALTSLDLSANAMGNGIPAGLGSIRGLVSLNLAGNELEGDIPDLRLPKLAFLQLRANSLSGRLPGSFTNLTSLTLLDLSGNTGLNQVSLVTAPAKLTRLRSLRLEFVGMTSAFPAALGALTNLTLLSLYNNNIYGGLPVVLTAFISLKELYLGGNRFYGGFPTFPTTSLQRLSLLDLFSNSLTGPLTLPSGALPSLQYLDLSSNQFSGPLPSFPTTYRRLTFLNLRTNFFSGKVPPSIAAFVSLRFLSLSRNLLKGFPASLPASALQQLTFLSLYGNQMSGAIPGGLSAFTALQSLDLSFNSFTGFIPAFFSTLSKMKNLDLSYNQLSGLVSQIKLNFAAPTYRCRLEGNFFYGAVVNPSQASAFSQCSVGNCVSIFPGGTNGDYSGRCLDFCSTRVPMPDRMLCLSPLSGLVSALVEYQEGPGGCQEGGAGQNYPGQAFTCSGGLVDSLGLFSLNNNKYPIPEQVSALTGITSLTLVYSNLGGNLPSSMGALTNLAQLDLSQNFLKGFIPQAWSTLVSLEYLDLSRNNLYGKLPGWVSALTSLTGMRLSYNNFTGGLYSTFTIPPLQYLSLAYNKLGGPVPQKWQASMQQLRLAGNFFGGSVNLQFGDAAAECYDVDIDGNCFDMAASSCVVDVKDKASCDAFCGQGFTAKPCNGASACLFNLTSTNFYCQ